ncbi:MAG: FKBP-type peptidyl-prolyl cis-trans isomerase [Methylophilaceae bacterium]
MKFNLFSVAALAAMLAIANPVTAEPAKEKTMMKKTVTELQKIDQTVGKGTEAIAGANVSVHYTGWLYDPSKPEGHGSKFDSSVDRGEPFTFLLGGQQVIKGWDDGVAGMKEGGKRTLIIPSHMGYGARGAGGVIPPNATLVFDVELLDVK